MIIIILKIILTTKIIKMTLMMKIVQVYIYLWSIFCIFSLIVTTFIILFVLSYAFDFTT